MRFTFAVMLSLYLTLPASAEDFAKIWDGTSFLVPTVSVQPRGTVRTSLTGFNGYYDGTHLRNEDALVFAQRFAPRWTRLQMGYALALQEYEFGYQRYYGFIEAPMTLVRDGISMAIELEASISSDLYDAELSCPLNVEPWPKLKATVSAGYGYRSAETYHLKVHPPKSNPFGDCIHQNPEEVWVHPRGVALEYAAHKNLSLSLEYARTTYYSTYKDWEYGKGYVHWTEVRQSIAPGVRFTSGGWSLAAGFPFAMNGKTIAEGSIFNLAYQSAEKKQ